MNKEEKTNVITDIKELQTLRNNFINKLEEYQEEINEVNKIITKYPKDKKSFELASDILNLKKQASIEYQELINKGGLLTSKNSIQRIITNLEAAYKKAQENCNDLDFAQEIFKQYKEELINLQSKETKETKDFENYIANLAYKITDLIWHLKIDSKEKDIFDIYTYNIEKYSLNSPKVLL